MLSKYIMPGDKVELAAVHKKKYEDSDGTSRVYLSKVSDIVSEERLEIIMPMEKTKLVLLPLDGEYEICFYAKAGIFECTARVIERYKTEGLYILLFELTSNLRKNQRREFYRFNCVLDIRSRKLTEEEASFGINKGMRTQEEIELLESSLQKGVVVDISGGGLRFVSADNYEPEDMIYMTFSLPIKGIEKNYELVGKVLYENELENRKGQFEHRVQYAYIHNKDREEIIRYIFEEERKNRKKR